MASVICKQCGKTFEGYPTRQFCDECNHERRNARQRKYYAAHREERRQYRAARREHYCEYDRKRWLKKKAESKS